MKWNKEKALDVSIKALKQSDESISKYYIKDISKWIKKSAKAGNENIIWTNWSGGKATRIKNICRNEIKRHFETLGFEVEFNFEHTVAIITWGYKEWT